MTDLFIMRHGEAAGFGLAGVHTDQERPLTTLGEEQTFQAGVFLQQQIKTIDWAMVSPFIRAQQTFAQVQRNLAVDRIEQNSEITPAGDSAAFGSELLARLQIEPAESVLLVSHMPFVGDLLAYLVPGIQAPFFTPAGIAHVKLSPLAMQGQLVAYHPIDSYFNS